MLISVSTFQQPLLHGEIPKKTLYIQSKPLSFSSGLEDGGNPNDGGDYSNSEFDHKTATQFTDERRRRIRRNLRFWDWKKPNQKDLPDWLETSVAKLENKIFTLENKTKTPFSKAHVKVALLLATSAIIGSAGLGSHLLQQKKPPAVPQPKMEQPELKLEATKIYEI